MRRSIALLAATAEIGLAGATLAVRPAHAADQPPGADVRLVYERPEIATNGSGVTWRWTLTNTGAGAAETVVATHRVSAGQQVVGVSPPCSTTALTDVVCSYGAIKPGEKRLGWLRTTVRPGAGMFRVNAQVTWREAPGTLPDIQDASGSWGMSGTDAAAPARGRPA
jgi:hypothetical protein